MKLRKAISTPRKCLPCIESIVQILYKNKVKLSILELQPKSVVTRLERETQPCQYSNPVAVLIGL